MKLLVATTQTQGQRQNDFCWATPGEILHFGSECDREGIDGACGCKRSLSGLDSLKATTTMIVAAWKFPRTNSEIGCGRILSTIGAWTTLRPPNGPGLK